MAEKRLSQREAHAALVEGEVTLSKDERGVCAVA
jgi:hypothetical protein